MVDCHSKLHVDRNLCDIIKPVWHHIKKQYDTIIIPFVVSTFGKLLSLNTMVVYLIINSTFVKHLNTTVGTACCSHACVGFLKVLQLPLTLQKH